MRSNDLTPLNWRCKSTWKKASQNTLWCLLGCCIGDFGTILWFQLYSPEAHPLWVATLAIMNGLSTSILLETMILTRTMLFQKALRTALGMSLISMVSMEVAMNLTDYLLVGSMKLTWWSILPSMLAGFLTPLPYNYWRLKVHGKNCH